MPENYCSDFRAVPGRGRGQNERLRADQPRHFHVRTSNQNISDRLCASWMLDRGSGVLEGAPQLRIGVAKDTLLRGHTR